MRAHKANAGLREQAGALKRPVETRGKFVADSLFLVRRLLSGVARALQRVAGVFRDGCGLIFDLGRRLIGLDARLLE